MDLDELRVKLGLFRKRLSAVSRAKESRVESGDWLAFRVRRSIQMDSIRRYVKEGQWVLARLEWESIQEDFEEVLTAQQQEQDEATVLEGLAKAAEWLDVWIQLNIENSLRPDAFVNSWDGETNSLESFLDDLHERANRG